VIALFLLKREFGEENIPSFYENSSYCDLCYAFIRGAQGGYLSGLDMPL